jgi:hypothetical protein
MTVTRKEAMGDSADPKLLRKIASFADKYGKHEFLPSMERVSDLLGSPRKFRNMVAVGATWLEDPLLLRLDKLLSYGKRITVDDFWTSLDR